MGYQDDFEDEGPCMHHRSLFDTIPAPPSFAASKPSEPTLLSARGDFTGKGDAGEPVRVSANGRAAVPAMAAQDQAIRDAHHGPLAFPGGVTEVRKPTREELVLSAQQWARRVRDDVTDNLSPGRVLGVLDRLDAVLKELADHG